MDLVGMEVRNRRRIAKVTILRRPNGSWSQREVGILTNGLKPLAVIHVLPRLPEILMIREEWGRAAIESVLGVRDFEHEVLEGYDNPKLPFPVPSI